jgi:hypothetical protein
LTRLSLKSFCMKKSSPLSRLFKLSDVLYRTIYVYIMTMLSGKASGLSVTQISVMRKKLCNFRLSPFVDMFGCNRRRGVTKSGGTFLFQR